MDMQEFAADTLLERGLPLPIRATLFFRLLGLSTKGGQLACYQPSGGNLTRINKHYRLIGVTKEQLNSIAFTDAQLLQEKHQFRQCRIIALAMVKGWILPVLLNRLIAFMLMWKLNPRQINSAAVAIVQYSGIEAFIDTTRYIGDLVILAPKNRMDLGHNHQRSL